MARAAFTEHLAAIAGEDRDIAKFNDEPGRTVADVIALCDKVAAHG